MEYSSKKEQLWVSLKQNKGKSKDNNEQESSFFCQTHQVKWLFVLFKACTLLCSVAEGKERELSVTFWWDNKQK